MKNPVIAKRGISSSKGLTSIVANASFLWERLNTERFVIDIDSINETEIQRRLDRWCQIVGDWNTLDKRLEWENLDLANIRPRLGSISWNPQAPLPAWAETLQQIMQMAKEFESALEIDLPINPENPIPFEDILLPAIAVARQQLLTRLGCELTEDSLPLSVLSKAAYRELERSLLQRLAELCTKTLNLEFSQVRPFGKNLLNLLGVSTEKSNNKTHYNKFVNQLLEDGLLSLFNKYPVLGRLVATSLSFWVESATEFIQRLAEDKADIQQIFSSKNDSLGKVSEIQTSLSDPHKRGRTVILITFESGLKLVYKPKDLGLEVAFNQFLDWCNQHSQLLDFKVIQVLNRDNYGWVEYITHQHCNDEAAVERFYQRAGMLLCVLYALRGTDCHHENLIASGEHLVLVDMETLLHHEANLIENSPNAPDFETVAEQQFWESVLRTGLLPRWDFSSDRRIAYDVSGLGSTDSQKIPYKLPSWQQINTDDMHLQYESVTMSVRKNVPRLGEIPLSASDYQAQITAGFEVMYRFLMMHQDILLVPGSPLTAMQNQQVRFVFRNTRIYSAISQKTLSPDYLKHGADYSIELDRLSRAFLVAQDKPNALPILSAELKAMEQLDIPFFTANAATDELSVSNELSIPQYFKQPSYQHALNQLQAMDEIDLARQTAIIQGSFHAKVAQTPSQDIQQWNTESLPLLSSAELIAEASAIATELERTAIPDPDGSVNWIGLGYVHEAERFRLQVLGYSLYDGRTGVALFLAALSQVTNDSRYRDLALKALQPLRRQIQTLNLESRQLMARLMGIGGGTGLGSIIYGLVKVSQFLKDETLLPDAQVLAEWMTPLIAADKKLDIMSGSAGAILGLLSLHRVTKNATVLEKAIAYGEHLLKHRISYENAPKAWQTLSEKPLTGFSHGAAGIAYALLQLYSVIQNQAYYEAALEGIEYERSVFSESHANWPDFRSLEPNQPPSFPVVWCHGAAGIGLGRLGCLRLAEIPGIEREIEIALQTTQNYGLEASDHLCCGNLGRIETLLVGAQRYSRSDLRQIALQNATNVVAKAKRTGAYQMFVNLPSSVFHPSLFRGTAGIGYEFLRLATDDLPSILLWE